MDTSLIRTAHALLDRYERSAALEVDVMASYDAQRGLADTCKALHARLDEPSERRNPAFCGMPQALATCLHLYDERGDAYAQLVAGIATPEQAFLDTYQGLALLNGLTRALMDDHDYAWDPQLRTIVSDGTSFGSLYLTPRRFGEILADVATPSSPAHPTPR